MISSVNGSTKRDQNINILLSGTVLKLRHFLASQNTVFQFQLETGHYLYHDFVLDYRTLQYNLKSQL